MFIAKAFPLTWIDSTEGLAMHVVVQHRITDLEKFNTMDAEEVAGGAPTGSHLQQFLPPKDGSVATCVWRSDSIDALRGYLDPATAGVTENTYIEVDDETAVGLPEAAAA
jgi:hypothetical protein